MIQHKDECLRSSLKASVKNLTTEKKLEGNKHVTFASQASSSSKRTKTARSSADDEKTSINSSDSANLLTTSPRKRQTNQEKQSEHLEKRNKHNERVIRLSDAQNTLVGTLKQAKELKCEAENTFLESYEALLNANTAKANVEMISQNNVTIQNDIDRLEVSFSSAKQSAAVITEQLSELKVQDVTSPIDENADSTSLLRELDELEKGVNLLATLCEKLKPLEISCDGYEEAIEPDPEYNDPKFTRDIWEWKEHRGCLLACVCQFYNYGFYPDLKEAKFATKSCINSIRRIVSPDEYKFLMDRTIRSWKNSNNTVAHLIDCLPEAPPLCSRADIFFDFDSSPIFNLAFMDACFTTIPKCSQDLQYFLIKFGSDLWSSRISNYNHLQLLQESILENLANSSVLPLEAVENFLLYNWGGTIGDFLSCEFV
uniref:GCFC domain-containing protein n=1 Tax=Syphacia muris TaxID=451379 RepID=A0A158R4L9_9BILA